MTDATPRTYPQGVPSWIEGSFPDPDAAADFYAALFGWQLEERLPPSVPGSYRIATLDGRDVGAIASSDDPAAWWTTIAVDDVDQVVTRVVDLGGTATAPADAGPGGSAGRGATCVDPRGAAFALWQARDRLGAQHINAPGGWVFSDLRSSEPDAAFSFYQQLFGWERSGVQEGPSTMLLLPGYGDHLAATSDPHIRERQAGAPPEFADVVAALAHIDAGPDDWYVTFGVADRDEATARIESLGGRVRSTWEGPYTRAADVVDPQGAPFRVMQYAAG
ncbi:VOC family protein [Microbacterium sp. M1A1_1b]